MAAFGSFLVPLLITFVVIRGGTWAVGNPEVVDDGFTILGGGWIDGKQASWPFVELHVTPEVIELRPRTIRSFAPVRITRADQLTISTVWSPMGRGVRFEGPTLGRRTTFWPARHAAVVEAMGQLSWPIGEPTGPAEPVATGPAPVRADHRIGYRCSPNNWLAAPVMAGFVVALVLFNPPVVFWLFSLGVWGWAAATTAYRVECDGIELRCFAPLWHRTIPVVDVLTIQDIAGTAASGGKTTITPRRGPRVWLLVGSRKDRANYAWFLDRLEMMAPSITIRR